MAPRGAPVKAAGKGTVAYAARRTTFGRLVEIEHEGGLITRYAHLAKISVKRGQQIAAGAQLGTVGRTGRATGYNLHFEVLIANKAVDPLSVVTWP